MIVTSREAREAAAAQWNRMLARQQNLLSADTLQGSSPPSVFVGEAGYPKVRVGPMVPPQMGDTSLLDAPERWAGLPLRDIVSYRLGLVRGVRSIPVGAVSGRYIQELQSLAMGDRPADSDMVFSGSLSMAEVVDGRSAPFGPAGSIKSMKISGVSANRHIQKQYYDTDLEAAQAIVELYESGTNVSRIQKCMSVGMFGKNRRLVPTKWSITATDDTISSHLIRKIQQYPLIDACRVFGYRHLGNTYAVILYPRAWSFGFSEAWYVNGIPAFGSDHEDGRGLRGYPQTAGAYFAARLAVAEYLEASQAQAAAIVLREISPSYTIPVGVWQVREGLREAMRGQPEFCHGMNQSLETACSELSIDARRWLAQKGIDKVVGQRSITEYW